QGPLSLLERKPYQRWTPPKLDGEAEARLTALACSPTPEGHARWTLRLLAEHLVKLEVVDSISHETVRQVLKKTSCSRGGKRCGVFRPNTTRHLSPTWSRYSRSINDLTARSVPSCAWMSRPNSSFPR